MSTLDHCPTCRRRITDFDNDGCETESGQRYCLRHVPHADYPHEPGRLHDCPACQVQCFCTGAVARGEETPRVFEGTHRRFSPLVLRYAEPTEHVDQTLATASWWDRYVFAPGDYDVELVSIAHRPIGPDVRPYYFRARVTARLVETYRVNRLLTASSVQHEHVDKETTFSVSSYAYSLEEGAQFCGGTVVRP